MLAKRLITVGYNSFMVHPTAPLSTSVKLRSILKKLGLKLPSQKKSESAVQVGHPILRKKAFPVSEEMLESGRLIEKTELLINTMRRFNAFGLSAPQMGLPLRMFVIEVSERQLKQFPQEFREERNIVEVPAQVFINPTIKIVDNTELVFDESCASLAGFYASVPRAKEIEITAQDASGDVFTYNAKDWTARIIQHENDHLDGILYIDKMISTTFSSIHWHLPKHVKLRTEL